MNVSANPHGVAGSETRALMAGGPRHMERGAGGRPPEAKERRVASASQSRCRSLETVRSRVMAGVSQSRGSSCCSRGELAKAQAGTGDAGMQGGHALGPWPPEMMRWAGG